MVGAEVTELIQGYVIARQLETTEQELMHTVFAHPTLSEMMHESVLGAYGQIGRAHVCTPVTNAHLVCRLLLEKKKKQSTNKNKVYICHTQHLQTIYKDINK